MRKEYHSHTRTRLSCSCSLDLTCIRISAYFCACVCHRTKRSRQPRWSKREEEVERRRNHISSSYVHKRYKEKWMVFMLWCKQTLHFTALCKQDPCVDGILWYGVCAKECAAAKATAFYWQRNKKKCASTSTIRWYSWRCEHFVYVCS